MNETNQTPIIQCKNITKTYATQNGVSQKNQVLHGITLDIIRGEIVCIVGKSGSGKSTLLNIMAGIDEATSGEVFNMGKNLQRMTSQERALFRQKNIGFVFQQFNLMAQYNAIENVALPLAFSGVPKAEREAKAKALLEKLGLFAIRNHRPAQLSGGEQQRVAVARALITDPQIIYADEPTGNLDTANTKEIMSVLCQQVKERHCTLVMITHDMSLTQFADRVITIQDGKIIN